MRRSILKELWSNRPTVYIPAVVEMMKKHPFQRPGNLRLYLRNMLYLNWQIRHRGNDF